MVSRKLTIKLRIRRYQCQKCNADVRSRFLFDGRVFDDQYFKVKMAQSRQRKKDLREKVREMFAESRSAALQLDALDLSSVPGLLGALNNLTLRLEPELACEAKARFDLSRYQKHIQAHIKDFPIGLTDIPALIEDRCRDLIWRFIAAIFLAHAGLLDVWQEGTAIMVKKHETDREGCEFSGIKMLMDSKDLSVELKPGRPSHMVLKGTYGEKIHKAFGVTRQGARWRFQRLFGEIYVEAFLVIMAIEKIFGSQLREYAVRISRERYALRQESLKQGGNVSNWNKQE